MLCTDITRGEQQCQTIAEEHESDIEFWWKHQDEYPGESLAPSASIRAFNDFLAS